MVIISILPSIRSRRDGQTELGDLPRPSQRFATSLFNYLTPVLHNIPWFSLFHYSHLVLADVPNNHSASYGHPRQYHNIVKLDHTFR
jgi:hypothetical protein